jgi:hypothetical protein
MPKLWAQPFLDILEPYASEWKNAKGKAERKTIVDYVVGAINVRLAESEGDKIENLEDVRVSHIF